jgi:hypothetical protein
VSETAPVQHVQHQRNEGGGWRREGGHRDGGYHRERDSQNEGPWRR